MWRLLGVLIGVLNRKVSDFLGVIGGADAISDKGRPPKKKRLFFYKSYKRGGGHFRL